jgi:hypothetical protein
MKGELPPEGTNLRQIYDLIAAGEFNRDKMVEAVGVNHDMVQKNIYKLLCRGLIAHSGFYRGYKNQEIKVYCLAKDAPDEPPLSEREQRKLKREEDSDDLSAYQLPRKKTYFSNVSFIFHAGRQ